MKGQLFRPRDANNYVMIKSEITASTMSVCPTPDCNQGSGKITSHAVLENDLICCTLCFEVRLDDGLN